MTVRLLGRLYCFIFFDDDDAMTRRDDRQTVAAAPLLRWSRRRAAALLLCMHLLNEFRLRRPSLIKSGTGSWWWAGGEVAHPAGRDVLEMKRSSYTVPPTL